MHSLVFFAYRKEMVKSEKTDRRVTVDGLISGAEQWNRIMLEQINNK